MAGQLKFAEILDHFASITSFTKVRIHLSPSLRHYGKNDSLKWFASEMMETTQGEGTLADEQSSTLADYEIPHVHQNISETHCAESQS